MPINIFFDFFNILYLNLSNIIPSFIKNNTYLFIILLLIELFFIICRGGDLNNKFQHKLKHYILSIFSLLFSFIVIDNKYAFLFTISNFIIGLFGGYNHPHDSHEGHEVIINMLIIYSYYLSYKNMNYIYDLQMFPYFATLIAVAYRMLEPIADTLNIFKYKTSNIDNRLFNVSITASLFMYMNRRMITSVQISIFELFILMIVSIINVLLLIKADPKMSQNNDYPNIESKN
jgi:hypothetical protein